MLVVDASCLYETVADGPNADPVRAFFAGQPEQAAPHIVDVEVFSAIRKAALVGTLDRSAASQAVDRLTEWPGERFGHRLLLDRAWELRDTVRVWDAMYVALAEALGAILLTRDRRLAAARGPRCEFELVS